MPANLSPEYKDAQEAFRRARDPHERLACLREMLRTIPRHKGTEHLQAELKTRIKELGDELSGPRRGGARGGPALVVHPEGAAQAVLLGPPNAGKSSLHARLTGSHAAVGPYPFTTQHPLPGMLAFEDVQFQLVDLPPVSADFLEPWLPGAIEQADVALLVVDPGEPDCVEQVGAIRRRLADKRITLAESALPGQSEDPFRVHLPALLLANKCDLLADPASELLALRELAGVGFPALAASAQTGLGLSRIGPLLFELAGILRVYTKVPGHAAARDRPFTLRRPATVRDVAQLVHRGRAAELKFARIWGSAEFDGQQVSGQHALRDGDVVELHW